MGPAVRERLIVGAWALRLPARMLAGAVGLRIVDGVRGCTDGEWVWFAGDGADPEMLRALVSIPAAELFSVDANGTCRVLGKRLPVATLPDGPWNPLRAWLEVELRPPALPAESPERSVLRVVRGGDERPANVLSTTLRRLHDWIGEAAEVRTSVLRFAADARGVAIVHGTPLPPLRGDVWCETDGVALPAGHRFHPDRPAPLVRAMLRLEPGDLASFDTIGRCSIVRARSFVGLSRAAVRATLREIDRG